MGYLIVFEHENEAMEFFSKKNSQSLIPELLSERDFKLPYFVGFDTLNELSKGTLSSKLFDYIAKKSIGNYFKDK